MFYFARCINIIFNSLLAQLVKYDVHTTRKIKFILAIFITYYYCTSDVAHFVIESLLLQCFNNMEFTF